MSDLYIPTIDLPILLQEICGPILGIYSINAHRHMNVEIGTDAHAIPGKGIHKLDFLCSVVSACYGIAAQYLFYLHTNVAVISL